MHAHLAFSYEWTPMIGLPPAMAYGSRSYNRYFGLLDSGKMKIRGVMAREGNTPDYVHSMPQECNPSQVEQGLIIREDVQNHRLLRLVRNVDRLRLPAWRSDIW